MATYNLNVVGSGTITGSFFVNNATNNIIITSDETSGASLSAVGTNSVMVGVNMLEATNAISSSNNLIGNTICTLASAASQCVGMGTDILANVDVVNSAIGIGSYVLTSTTVGNYNTGVGFGVLNGAGPVGTNNVGVGTNVYQSASGTTGSSNVGVGAGVFIGTANNNNVGIGTTVFGAITGNSNIGLGTSVLSGTTGSYNIALGNNVFASANVAGNNNIGIGANITSAATIGDYNTFIGSSTGTAVASLTRSTAIGVNAQATYNSQIMLGTGNEYVSIPGQLQNGVYTMSGTTATIGGSVPYPNYLFYMNTNGGTLTINPHLAISTTSTIKLRIRRGYVGTATAGTLTVQTRTGTTTNAIIVGLKNDTPVATFNISGTTANAMNMHMVLYDGKWYLSQ